MNHFGEKLHLDQNEKRVIFGITHVVAVDGYSRKIVGLITIPKKNPIVIYDLLFLPLLNSHGLWEQVRVDHGTEFALIILPRSICSTKGIIRAMSQSCKVFLAKIIGQNVFGLK